MKYWKTINGLLKIAVGTAYIYEEYIPSQTKPRYFPDTYNPNISYDYGNLIVEITEQDYLNHEVIVEAKDKKIADMEVNVMETPEDYMNRVRWTINPRFGTIEDYKDSSIFFKAMISFGELESISKAEQPFPLLQIRKQHIADIFAHLHNNKTKIWPAIFRGWYKQWRILLYVVNHDPDTIYLKDMLNDINNLFESYITPSA